MTDTSTEFILSKVEGLSVTVSAIGMTFSVLCVLRVLCVERFSYGDD